MTGTHQGEKLYSIVKSKHQTVLAPLDNAREGEDVGPIPHIDFAEASAMWGANKLRDGLAFCYKDSTHVQEDVVNNKADQSTTQHIKEESSRCPIIEQDVEVEIEEDAIIADEEEAKDETCRNKRKHVQLSQDVGVLDKENTQLSGTIQPQKQEEPRKRHKSSVTPYYKIDHAKSEVPETNCKRSVQVRAEKWERWEEPDTYTRECTPSVVAQNNAVTLAAASKGEQDEEREAQVRYHMVRALRRYASGRFKETPQMWGVAKQLTKRFLKETYNGTRSEYKTAAVVYRFVSKLMRQTQPVVKHMHPSSMCAVVA